MSSNKIANNIIEKVWAEFLAVLIATITASAVLYLSPIIAIVIVASLLLFSAITIATSRGYRNNREQIKQMLTRQVFDDESCNPASETTPKDIKRDLEAICTRKHVKNRGFFLKVKSAFSFDAYERRFWGDLSDEEIAPTKEVLCKVIFSMGLEIVKNIDEYDWSKVDRLASKCLALYNLTDPEKQASIARNLNLLASNVPDPAQQKRHIRTSFLPQ